MKENNKRHDPLSTLHSPLFLAVAAAAEAEGMSESSMLLLASVLLAACVCLFILEIFIPSLGLIAIAAVACAAASIWFGFQVDGAADRSFPVTGWTFVVLNAGLIPTSIVLGFKLLSRTDLVVNKCLDATAVTDEQKVLLKSLLGKQGKALTMLRPAGSARLENTTLSVQTRGEFVDPDSLVEVIAVEGNQVFVKLARS